MSEQRFSKFRIWDFRNFSLREAIFLAILLHLILLMLPTSVWDTVFWNREPVVRAMAEPITFRVKQPEQQPEMTEITKPEEKHEAVSPEKIEGPPVTKQPTVTGETNLKALESPPPSTTQQPQEQQRTRPADTGRQQVRPMPELLNPYERRENPETEKQRVEEASKKLARLMDSGELLKPSDFPIKYDNQLPSSATFNQDLIRFDTYDWNWQPYQAYLLRKLYTYWVPKLQGLGQFRMGMAGRTVITFTIRRNGSLEIVQMLEPSGINSYDAAANHSIVTIDGGYSTPFKPLPGDFPKESLTVTIGFYVNTNIPRNQQ